jgi:hypothetical protein
MLLANLILFAATLAGLAEGSWLEPRQRRRTSTTTTTTHHTTTTTHTTSAAPTQTGVQKIWGQCESPECPRGSIPKPGEQ